MLTGHERSVYSVSWGVGKGVKEGSLGWVASTGGDGSIRVWELSVWILAFFFNVSLIFFSLGTATDGRDCWNKYKYTGSQVGCTP